MKQNYDISSSGSPSDTAFAALKARAFTFRSLAPRAADVLRASLQPIDGTVVTAQCGGELVGYVALWPIHLQSGDAALNLCLLGPLMVDPQMQTCGVGSDLMHRVLGFADAKKLPPILLVGDAGYYHRFGFQPDLAAAWIMPGVAAPSRMLLRPHQGSNLVPETGAILPAFAPPCEKQAAA